MDLLERGAVHEWFGGSIGDGGRRQSGDFIPPVAVLIQLAKEAMSGGGTGRGESGASEETPLPSPASSSSPGFILWVGRRIWPYPPAMAEMFRRQPWVAQRLIRRSVFIDPLDESARVWTIEKAARSPAVRAVISDGSGLSLSAIRRLQLAAEAGAGRNGNEHARGSVGGLVLLARPPSDEGKPSAARTRWRVAPFRSPGGRCSWMISLVRAKGRGLGWSGGSSQRWASSDSRDAGMRGTIAPGMERWLVELSHGEGLVRIPADVVDRSGEDDSPSDEAAVYRFAEDTGGSAEQRCSA